MIVTLDTGDYFELKIEIGNTNVKYYKKNDDGEFELEVEMNFNSKDEALKALDSFEDYKDLL